MTEDISRSLLTLAVEVREAVAAIVAAASEADNARQNASLKRLLHRYELLLAVLLRLIIFSNFGVFFNERRRVKSSVGFVEAGLYLEFF